MVGWNSELVFMQEIGFVHGIVENSRFVDQESYLEVLEHPSKIQGLEIALYLCHSILPRHACY